MRSLPSLTPDEFTDDGLNQRGPLVRNHARALGIRRSLQSHPIIDFDTP